MEQHRDAPNGSGAGVHRRALWHFSRPAIIISACVLAALTWIGTLDAIRSHRGEVSARVHAEILAGTRAFEEQLRRQLLSVEQTLRILQYEWQRDPQHFDLAAWYDKTVVVRDVSLQLFLADTRGSIRLSTRPGLIGTDISGRDYFRHEAELPANDDKMFVGGLTEGQVTRLWQINLVRRLDNPDGSFAGVIAASYDTNAFSRFYDEINLGRHVLIGVVSMRDGDAWTLSGASRSPVVFNIAHTPVFAAMRRAAEGNWMGASGLDDTDRLYAFAPVPDRDLNVVIGLDRQDAMAAILPWERGALLFGSGITILVFLMAVLLLREQGALRRRHDALAHERAILVATLTGMSDGIMMVDADLRLMAWNQHFPEFTGVPPEILRVGLPMDDILRAQIASGEFGPVDAEAEVARRLALLRSGATVGTIERPRPGGRQLQIRRRALPGGGFVTLYTDVTARRQTEERLRQAQTLAAIGRLTAGIAHDFNNLLAAISGNTEILHARLRDDPVHGPRLAGILETVARGTDLVRRLLAFSRKQPLAPERLDLNGIVRGMADLLRATLGRTIRVETQLAPDLWLALIDPIQIEHMILNLAINARDAMPSGGTLTISTVNMTLAPNDASSDLPAGDYATVSVSDTGTGMSEEVLRNAFEPFFTTKPPGQGSGLGLSQVYGVATQSGGGVKIESTLGKGTTIRILFPRSAEQPEAETEPLSESPGAGDRQPDKAQHWTILVVDTETESRDTLAAMLSANGFSVVTAERCDQALRLIENGLDFHLLLTELAMPDMNGVELARQVRARRALIPAVFITDTEAEWVGGEPWVLRKPLLPHMVVETLQAALGLRRGPNARRSQVA